MLRLGRTSTGLARTVLAVGNRFKAVELGVKPNVEYSNNHDKYKAFFLAYKAYIASQSPDSPNADYLKTAEEFRAARVEAEKERADMYTPPNQQAMEEHALNPEYWAKLTKYLYPNSTPIATGPYKSDSLNKKLRDAKLFLERYGNRPLTKWGLYARPGHRT